MELICMIVYHILFSSSSQLISIIVSQMFHHCPQWTLQHDAFENADMQQNRTGIKFLSKATAKSQSTYKRKLAKF